MITQSSCITRLALSLIDCPLQAAALEWWIRRDGRSELQHDPYLMLAPHLQIALDEKKSGTPRFFYVGERSMTANLLGNNFTSAIHAGAWWDDGGYADAVSEVYSEISNTNEAVLEQVAAPIRPPVSVPYNPTVMLFYYRLCLPTRLENGQKTFTVVSSWNRTETQPTAALTYCHGEI